jgi:hygromycin-B 4-O-kinase
VTAPGDADVEARAAAEAAIHSSVGEIPAELEPAEGGLTNVVFSATTAQGPLIVRVGEPGKRPGFERERMVIQHVRREGVPAPEVLSVGEADGYAFMIARRLPGDMAVHHPERLRTLKALGALAAGRIHVIRTRGFGKDFEFNGPAATGGWRAWLVDGLGAPGRLDLLRRHGVISREREEELMRTLERVEDFPDEAVLNHGDLRLKNVVADEDGAIVGLIDWEECVSCLGPHWDLSVALHDLWADQIQAFMEGYGMGEAEMRTFAPVWRLYNALNYAPEVERIVAEGDEPTLKWIRIRFSGALDVFGGR